jgi:lipopolysaccharide transport system ATP-binding protein
MPTSVALSCRGLSKTFIVSDGGNAWRILFDRAHSLPRVNALTGVDITVPKGEFVGVIGRNGAGKSTLLRTLGGAYEPSAGSIEREADLAALYELGSAGNMNMTGTSYARRYLELTGSRGVDITSLIDEIADFSELDERMGDNLHTYSAGMQARLFFACATAERHDLYLIDEVLSVGDAHFQTKCWRRIRERLANGASGVLVTHDWSAVLKLCRTAHTLDGGRIVDSGAAQEVVRSYLRQAVPDTPPSEMARFVELPKSLRWNQNDDVVLDLMVDCNKPWSLKLVYAIEKLVLGFGWEIMLNGIDIPLAPFVGRRTVRLVLPRLPLAPGMYTMALHLVEVSPGDLYQRTLHDGVGWLTGTPIEITVDGPATEGAFSLPGRWSIDTP